MNRNLLAIALAATLLLPAVAGPALAADEDYQRFVGTPPPTFESADALVEAFKARLEADDAKGFAALLGLDPAEVAKQDTAVANFERLQDAASEKIVIEEDSPDREFILLGTKVWPFPFPMVMKDGKWAFDTVAGIEEVINRRIGDNELETIKTVRAIVIAQEAYRANDWDGDGVLEYAQKLVSTAGKFDGLYWPPGAGIPDSPAGPYISQAQIKDNKEGYFGYTAHILPGQGANISGGRYSYVTNGNMVGGFGLVAWPVTYGQTGVMTFAVNQYGTVYQKDLGENTAAIAAKMSEFNPDGTWSIVTDATD